MPLATSDLFILASIGFVQLLAVISPGPSFLITARVAAARSRGDGLKVALGLGAGTFIWALATFLGLNTLFHLFPPLFMMMKALGAVFLLWVAWRIYRHATSPLDLDASTAATGGSPFLRGLLVQLSNPKVAVFFGSIFVAMLPAVIPLWLTVALIAVVTFNEIWWYSVVALFFSSGPVRAGYMRAKAWIDRAVAVFLGGLGLRLLWSVREAA